MHCSGKALGVQKLVTFGKYSYLSAKYPDYMDFLLYQINKPCFIHP